jgi:hypothetical protein
MGVDVLGLGVEPPEVEENTLRLKSLTDRRGVKPDQRP